MSEVKHTPLPWKMTIARYTPDSPAFGFDLTVEGKLPSIASAGVHQAHVLTVSEEFRKSGNFSEYFSPEEVEANANFIDRALNSHEGLVEALKLIADGNQGAMVTWIRSQGETRSGLSDMFMGQLRQLIAETALAKAGRP